MGAYGGQGSQAGGVATAVGETRNVRQPLRASAGLLTGLDCGGNTSFLQASRAIQVQTYGMKCVPIVAATGSSRVANLRHEAVAP
jgi:hypothetical protein